MKGKLVVFLFIFLFGCGGGHVQNYTSPQPPTLPQDTGGCMSANALLAALGNPLIIVDAADFDGTNDYMARGADLTGMADGKTGIVSFWYRVDGGDGSNRFILGNYNNAFAVFHDTSNKLSVFGVNSAVTTILDIDSTTAYTASGTWLHVLVSWDLANTTAHLYINDSSDLTSNTLTDDTIDYTTATPNWWVGAGSAASFKMNACIAELYFAPNQYLDFSLEANRRKFISADGKPVHLGTDGSLPTGTAPIVYQHLDDGEAVANFATNAGTGGDFSITGTLDTASTSPSD